MVDKEDCSQPYVIDVSPPTIDEKEPTHKTIEEINMSPIQAEDDQVLSIKMAHVNNAIDEIGFTSYQLKLFFLNGFGYAVDSLLILLNALTQPQVALQYQPKVSKTQSIAANIGLLLGALFWGLGADVSRIVKGQRNETIDFVSFRRSLDVDMLLI